MPCHNIFNPDSCVSNLVPSFPFSMQRRLRPAGRLRRLLSRLSSLQPRTPGCGQTARLTTTRLHRWRRAIFQHLLPEKSLPRGYIKEDPQYHPHDWHPRSDIVTPQAGPFLKAVPALNYPVTFLAATVLLGYPLDSTFEGMAMHPTLVYQPKSVPNECPAH